MKFADYLKRTALAFFITSSFIAIAIGILGLIFEPARRFGYESFFSPLIIGLAATAPSIILYSSKELTFRQMAMRKILHFLVLEATLIGFGFAFRFLEAQMVLSFALSVLIIWGLVNLIIWRIDHQKAGQMTKNLKTYQQNRTIQEKARIDRMAIDKVREHLKQWNKDGQILEFDVSSATVELAAQAVHCEPERIAKTLSFQVDNGCVLIVTAGDAKIDNGKFKAIFKTKAKMLPPDKVFDLIGHEPGGVCPFGINEGVEVYLDQSLKRFASVYPACGSSNSAIELTPDELALYANSLAWIDVCKGWSGAPEPEQSPD